MLLGENELCDYASVISIGQEISCSKEQCIFSKSLIVSDTHYSPFR